MPSTPEPPKSGIRQQIELLESIEDAANERAAAYEHRADDPERWAAAKQHYADIRRYYRTLNRQSVTTASAISKGGPS